MKQCMDSENLHRRLKKIIGQVQAIDRMIDEDIPCEDILSQLNAAKSALHKCGQVVLEGHIKHCVRDGIEHGDPDHHGRGDQVTLPGQDQIVRRSGEPGQVPGEGLGCEILRPQDSSKRRSGREERLEVS